MITGIFGFCPRLLSFSNRVLKHKILNSEMNLFFKQKPKETWIFCLHSLEKISLNLSHFYKTCLFFRKTAFTHTFTFQAGYLIKPRWRWHIYLDPHQIWTWLAKCAMALKRINWTYLSENSGLLAGSGWTRPQWREGL